MPTPAHTAGGGQARNRRLCAAACERLDELATLPIRIVRAPADTGDR